MATTEWVAPGLFDLAPASTPTSQHPDGRVILMDLNVALSSNFHLIRHYRMSDFVSHVEEYRQWMVDLLRPEHVVLITARSTRWRDATLRRIRQQTGWEPQHPVFNDTGIPGSRAHDVKRALLETHVFPRYGGDVDRYLAIDSNWRTRQMYAQFSIRAVNCSRDEPWERLPD